MEEEYLRWYFWSNVVGIVVGTGFVWLANRIGRAFERESDEQEKALIATLSLGFLFAGIVTFIVAGICVLKVSVAPSIVLEEHHVQAAQD